MSTFYVRKDGSGTHTDITSAYMAASINDTIDIGEGTFIESIEVFKNNLTFVGASKATTIIQGIPFLAVQTASVCNWTSGNNFFTVGGVATLPAFTVGMSLSDIVNATNSPSGAQITSIDSANRKIYINKNFTTTLSSKVMKHWGRIAAIELRASGFTMSKIKVIDDSASSAAVELSAIFIGASQPNQGASKVSGTSSTGFSISDCEFVAVGDYAMLSEANNTVGNGTVTNCLFSGKTFSGVNSVAGAVRQGVVFQNANLPITFVNNTLDMVCGGMTTANVYSGNQVATIDAYGSIVTGNSFKGRAINASGVYFNLAGLALRMRGGNATVNNNSIQGSGGFTTYGYLILPTYTNLSGKTIPVGEVVTNSSRFFKCTQAHLYAADKTPVAGASWASYWTELTGTAEQIGVLLIENGKANYHANSGTNITITKLLIAVTQAAANSFINSEMGKDVLKSISKVSSDAVFSNDANWKLVSYIFKHSSSSRRLVSSFRAFESSKKTKLKTNMQVGDVFELYRIIISKPDRTPLVIKRSEISGASGFDFSLLANGPSAPTPPVGFSRDFLSPAGQQDFEFGATPFGTIQYTASGLRLNQAGFNPNNYHIYYTSPLSAYFPNSSQNYTVKVSYEVVSIDTAFSFLKILLGDGTVTMNYGDPRLSVGIHTDEVFTFNACNVQAGGNSFQFWMNAQDNTEIKFFDFAINSI